MPDDIPERPWIAHKPEQRLSIVVDHFLNHALLEPFYCTANHDADGGGRTERQRARDRERGVRPGALDWEIWQGHLHGPLARKLELKRGRNGPSDNQLVTIAKLTALGAPPVVAWTLREAHAGLAAAGFRFGGNVETLLQKYEAQLDALDREAEAKMAGTSVRKASRPRKATPGRAASAGFVRRAASRGILV